MAGTDDNQICGVETTGHIQLGREMARTRAREEARNLYKIGKSQTLISSMLGVPLTTLSRWKKEDQERYGIDWEGLKLAYKRSAYGAREQLQKLYDRMLEELSEGSDPGRVDALYKVFCQIEKFEQGVTGEKIILILDQFAEWVAKHETEEGRRAVIAEHIATFIKEAVKR